jgi:hypothetical protein
MYILEVHEDSILIGEKIVEINALSLKFMRRIQISQYEPAEVEFTLHATLDEDEDHLDAGKALAKDARAMIKEAFSGLVKQAEVETETPPAEVPPVEKPKAKPKGKGGRPKGSKNKAKEKTGGTAANDIPDDPVSSNGVPDGAGNSEIPDTDGDAVPQIRSLKRKLSMPVM